MKGLFTIVIACCIALGTATVLPSQVDAAKKCTRQTDAYKRAKAATAQADYNYQVVEYVANGGYEELLIQIETAKQNDNYLLRTQNRLNDAIETRNCLRQVRNYTWIQDRIRCGRYTVRGRIDVETKIKEVSITVNSLTKRVEIRMKLYQDQVNYVNDIYTNLAARRAEAKTKLDKAIAAQDAAAEALDSCKYS